MGNSLPKYYYRKNDCDRGLPLYREDRNRNEGGVAVYVHNSIKHVRQIDLPDKSLELVCIETQPLGARPFLIISWYRLPSAAVEKFGKIEVNLKLFYRENKEIIILGYSKCDLSSLFTSGHNDLPSKLLTAIQHNFLLYIYVSQIINEPTIVTLTSSLIDHIATNKFKLWLDLL